jgi:phage terminase small subunit
MTGPQIKFAEGIAQGLNQTEAYMAAYPKCRAKSARSKGSRLVTNGKISDHIERLRKLAESELIGTVKQRLERLWNITECGDDGDTIRAIAEMNKMTGGYEPERHELEIIVTIGGARTVE